MVRIFILRNLHLRLQNKNSKLLFRLAASGVILRNLQIALVFLKNAKFSRLSVMWTEKIRRCSWNRIVHYIESLFTHLQCTIHHLQKINIFSRRCAKYLLWFSRVHCLPEDCLTSACRTTDITFFHLIHFFYSQTFPFKPSWTLWCYT